MCQNAVDIVLCTAAVLVLPMRGTVPPKVEMINAVLYVLVEDPPVSVACIVKRSPATISAVFVVSLHDVAVLLIVQVNAVSIAFLRKV